MITPYLQAEMDKFIAKHAAGPPLTLAQVRELTVQFLAEQFDIDREEVEEEYDRMFVGGMV